MLRAFEQMHKDFYDTVSQRTAKPFYIRNETGMDLHYWITGTTQRTKLNSGDELPLDVMTLEAAARPMGQRFQQHKIAQSVSIQFTEPHDDTPCPGNGKMVCNISFSQGMEQARQQRSEQQLEQRQRQQ
jgi:hypothetical protein